MGTVETLYNITMELCDVIAEVPTDRDQTITQLTELLKQRDVYIQQLKAPYTQEEMTMGQEILEKNLFIDQKLKAIMSDIVHDRQTLSKKKRTSSYYKNPYQKIMRDGVFLDKKE